MFCGVCFGQVTFTNDEWWRGGESVGGHGYGSGTEVSGPHVSGRLVYFSRMSMIDGVWLLQPLRVPLMAPTRIAITDDDGERGRGKGSNGVRAVRAGGRASERLRRPAWASSNGLPRSFTPRAGRLMSPIYYLTYTSRQFVHSFSSPILASDLAPRSQNSSCGTWQANSLELPLISTPLIHGIDRREET